MEESEPYITIPQAAKAVGMHRGRMREVCIAAEVAVRWGGSDARPHLRVKLSDARRAVAGRKYVKPDAATKKRRRPAAGRDVSHPLVTC